MSDFIGIFSDFDYDFNMNESQEEPDSDDSESKIPNKSFSQENFLDYYDGIIVSFENFFIMNHLEIIQIFDH